MFTERQRDVTRDGILEIAKKDGRLVSCAFVGSTAEGTDRWSDLDLTFGVGTEHDVSDVLNDWTSIMKHEFSAVQLFDVQSNSTTYRVFLLPDNLQVDLSFTPESDFGAIGPRFKLLYGKAIEKRWPEAPTPSSLFGLAAHHLVRARICVERGKLWQAEYWISSARDQALAIACMANGLTPYHGRGYDQLPGNILDAFKGSFVSSLDRESLLSALRNVVRGVLFSCSWSGQIASDLERQLLELNEPS